MRVIWGGTFDPVHNGHIQLARELVAKLGISKLYLMPCFQAVHKDNVAALPYQRLDMLKIATQHCSELGIDTREILKQSPSYTYQSLLDVRQEIGKQTLCFVIGTDSLFTFPDWYRAEDMHTLTNLIIIERPLSSFSFDASKDDGLKTEQQKMKHLSDLGFLQVKSPDQLKDSTVGRFLKINLTAMDISSSGIRERVKKRENITHLVDDGVNHYINMHNLYSK